MSAAAAPAMALCRLLGRQDVAAGTVAFRFEKPANWTFLAGQYVDITLIDPSDTDAEGNTRTFSIASSPREETLMVATRMRETAFKRSLKTLPFGSMVRVDGPAGTLTLDGRAERAAVLLAGGIGITPFRSIVLDASERNLSHPIFLFYSNRRPEDAPFLEELRALEGRNRNFRLIASVTEMSQADPAWSGESGRIDKEMLAKYLANMASPFYYVAGPPGMVAGLRTMLGEAGIPDVDICAEEFAGY